MNEHYSIHNLGPEAARSRVQDVAARHGIEVPSTTAAAEARVAELTRITELPDPELPLIDAPDLSKAIQKLARDRVQIAAQREIASELLPAARAATQEEVSSELLGIVVDALVEDYAGHVEDLRQSLDGVVDVTDDQLGRLSVGEFAGRQNAIGTISALEHCVADRIELASVTGDQQSVNTDLRRWGAWPTLFGVLKPPPRDAKTLIAEYSALFAALKELAGADPFARWRSLIALDKAGTLALSMANIGESSDRAAMAVAWWDARFSLQAIGVDLDDRSPNPWDTSESMWKTLTKVSH